MTDSTPSQLELGTVQNPYVFSYSPVLCSQDEFFEWSFKEICDQIRTHIAPRKLAGQTTYVRIEFPDLHGIGSDMLGLKLTKYVPDFPSTFHTVHMTFRDGIEIYLTNLSGTGDVFFQRKW